MLFLRSFYVLFDLTNNLINVFNNNLINNQVAIFNGKFNKRI
jgi:hypothetical protein